MNGRSRQIQNNNAKCAHSIVPMRNAEPARAVVRLLSSSEQDHPLAKPRRARRTAEDSFRVGFGPKAPPPAGGCPSSLAKLAKDAENCGNPFRVGSESRGCFSLRSLRLCERLPFISQRSPRTLRTAEIHSRLDLNPKTLYLCVLCASARGWVWVAPWFFFASFGAWREMTLASPRARGGRRPP